MNKKVSIAWISTAGIVGILFGIFYAFFGLSGFPAYRELVPSEVMIPWSNGLYGSVFIGFSVLLFFIGRYALIKNDKYLMKLLLYGILSWILVEAAFSFLYGVYFNLLVDLALIVFLGYPFWKNIQNSHTKNN